MRWISSPHPHTPAVLGIFRALLPLEGASHIPHSLHNQTGRAPSLHFFFFQVAISFPAHLLEHFAKRGSCGHGAGLSVAEDETSWPWLPGWSVGVGALKSCPRLSWIPQGPQQV